MNTLRKLALANRQSQREFARSALSDQVLSDLMWAAAGVNRPEVGGHQRVMLVPGQQILLAQTVGYPRPHGLA